MDESSQSLKTTSTKRNAESCFYLFMHAQQRKAYRVEEKAVGFSLVLTLQNNFCSVTDKKRLDHCMFMVQIEIKNYVRNK